MNYIDSKEEWLREKFGIERAPSYTTIWWLLVLMDPNKINEAFERFIEEIRSTLITKQNKKEEFEAIAIDGKTNRGTKREGIKALHMVSAWSSSLQLLLGQVKTDEKSNEITAIPELLNLLDLEGKVVTIDAMGCQVAIAQKIVDEGGHYILALKGNQETIHEEVKAVFENVQKQDKNIDIPVTSIEEASETEKGHGRIEERTARVITGTEWLKKDKKWKSVRSIIEIVSKRAIGVKTTVEKRYYLSDMEAGAGQFLRWIRSHWGVESFHWTMDVSFREDHFQGHTGHLAENFSLLQRVTLMLLKQENSVKKSIAKKRDRAGWNNDYLLKILGV